MNEKKPSKPFYTRREVILGGAGLGGLAVSAMIIPEFLRSPEEKIVRAYVKAYGTVDFENVLRLLAPDFAAVVRNDKKLRDEWEKSREIWARGGCYEAGIKEVLIRKYPIGTNKEATIILDKECVGSGPDFTGNRGGRETQFSTSRAFVTLGQVNNTYYPTSPLILLR